MTRAALTGTARPRLGAALTAAALVAAAAFPFMNGEAVSQVTEVLVDAIAVAGLNIAAGYSGLIAVGVGALVGVGAYSAALLNVDAGVPIALAIPAGTVVATLIGMLLLAPSLRLGRAAFAMLSLFTAYAFAGAATIKPLQHLIHADTEGGLTSIAALVPLRSAGDWQEPVAYWIVLAVLVLSVAVCARLTASHWGRALRAVRDDEVGAASMGVNPVRARLLALFVCAFWASASGALYAATSQGCVDTCGLSVGRFSLTFSIFLFSALVVGGRATVAGPVLGSLLVGWYFVLEAGSTGGSGVWAQLIGEGAAYGVVLLVVATWMPAGVWGMVRRVWTRGPAPGAAADAATTVSLSLPRDDDDGATPLHVSALTVRFGGVTALDDVAMACAAGGIHAVIGANGSGKTTLLNAISGLVTADRGAAIAFGEQRIDGIAAHLRARAGLGRTFQTPRIAEALSVTDNAVMGAFARYRHGLFGLYVTPWRYARQNRAIRAEAGELLRAVGLDGHAAVAAAGLSHGRRRLLEVARALLGRPRVLLLDEPAAGLDEAELTELATVLTAARDAGCAVVLVEHNLAFVRRVASTATALDQGRVLADGPVAEVLARDDVITAFVGRRVA